MILQSKTAIIQSLKIMHVTIILLTCIGLFFNMKLAGAGLFILFVMLLNSEIPIRRYLNGKPMIIFGCTASEAKTKEDEISNLKHHLIFIVLGFSSIVINFLYIIYSHYAN